MVLLGCQLCPSYTVSNTAFQASRTQQALGSARGSTPPFVVSGFAGISVVQTVGSPLGRYSYVNREVGTLSWGIWMFSSCPSTWLCRRSQCTNCTLGHLSSGSVLRATAEAVTGPRWSSLSDVSRGVRSYGIAWHERTALCCSVGIYLQFNPSHCFECWI